MGVSALLGAAPVSADDVVDLVNVNIPVSCSLTGTNLLHNTEVRNGQYISDIGSANITAFCNDTSGFAIYAIGFTGDTDGNNKMRDSALGTEYDIATGKYVRGTTTDSVWAMKLTPVSGTYAPTIRNDANYNYTDFEVVPSEHTRVVSYSAATDLGAGALGSSFTTNYAVYASETQPAGTYTGKVKFTLVHPEDAPAPGPKSLDTATTLQDVTYCSDKLPEGQVYTLTDSRDGNVYHVARLADGKCWMLDNLALDPTDATTAANMNENNTNASAEAINNLLHGGSSTTGWSSTAVADVDTNFSNNGFTIPRINNASKDTLVISYGPASTNGQAKVGLYYNYCAASASTYCYESGQGVDIPDTIIDAPQDICPVNWRMPTGGDNGEYNKLYQKYNTTQDVANTASLQYNLSTPLSGYYSNSSALNKGNGNWWSSTYRGSYYMYSLYVDPTDVYPYSFNRYYGGTMRCLVGE